MKNCSAIVYLLVLTALFFSACNNAAENTATTPTTIGPSEGDTSSVIAPKFSDSVGAESTASTALDYDGMYKGVTPCADCEGIEISISIGADKKYTKTTKYLGKKESKEIKLEGSWNWVNGNVIQLEGVTDGPNQYFVSENALIQLDMEGKKITGALAEKYILSKSL
jgi:uncharacterized lipoprotein NlpE involved in copper resistance